MRLLFDQNISFRIVKLLAEFYPEVGQVRTLGLENSSDIEIWNYAKANKYTIITFDADFYEISTIQGHPPKIIWLRFGNTTTKNIAEVILEKVELINDFVEDQSDISCLEID